MTATSTVDRRMFVINRRGTVHRQNGDSFACEVGGTAFRREYITANQAMVYALAPCATCWPDLDAFQHIVKGRVT